MSQDIVMNLARKKARLVDLRRRAQEDADRTIRGFDEEIRKIDQALAQINAAVQDYLCPACGGSGEEPHTDAAGQMESVPCSKCGGTGVKV